MTALIDGYDAALFDLDGVVYLGPIGVEGAAEGIAALRAEGVLVAFVTNNAARRPQTVAEHLVSLGIPCTSTDVVVSSQAIARLMAEELPAGAAVLVLGTEALAEQIRAVGLRVVGSHRDYPDAVVQGYHPELSQPMVDDACYALQGGARWYASNPDLTRPTDLGMVPGAGAQIALVAVTTTSRPVMAGKPFRPLLDETIARLGARRPIFVGDRLDTDIEGAHNVGIDSLFVFSGTHGKHDLAGAAPQQRPTHLGLDLRALLAPARTVLDTPGGTACGAQLVGFTGTGIRLLTRPADRPGQLDALAAILRLCWRHPQADRAAALAALDQLH